MTPYALTATPNILRTADATMIPRDPRNGDYQAFLEWQAAGGIPDPVPPATLVDAAAMARRSPLSLTFSGSITLGATPFPLDVTSLEKILRVVTYLNLTGAFPNGQMTFPMRDAAGLPHYLTIPQYKTVSAVILTYVSALELISDGNPYGAATLPTSSVSVTLP